MELDRRVADAVKRAVRESELRAEEAERWDANGMDATGRRLLQENKSLTQELQLHIQVVHPINCQIAFAIVKLISARTAPQ